MILSSGALNLPVFSRTGDSALSDSRPGPLAQKRRQEPLPALIYGHKSLIRRRLGQVDMELQENKAVNLALAAPRVNGVFIQPGQTFSVRRLVSRSQLGGGTGRA